jgi:hypothetical protein
MNIIIYYLINLPVKLLRLRIGFLDPRKYIYTINRSYRSGYYNDDNDFITRAFKQYYASIILTQSGFRRRVEPANVVYVANSEFRISTLATAFDPISRVIITLHRSLILTSDVLTFFLIQQNTIVEQFELSNIN